MKVFLALILGAGLGAGLFWLFTTNQGRMAMHSTEEHIGSAAKSANDLLHEKLRLLDLSPQDVKKDLAETGQVVRHKARQAGSFISDATLDSRITTAIKGKFVASRDLSALRISVNTTDGVVTLSGSVTAAEDISKAVLVAMETEGVREVISTLQVKPATQKK